jgi:hypothetical protein
MAFIFPTSPTTGTQFVAPTGYIYLYDTSASWTTKGDTQPSNPFTDSFRYRTIYTRGYVSAGYKSGSPWRNVNKTQHSTDVTTNLGDMVDYNASYIGGGFSDYYHYVYGMSGAVNGSSTHTSSVNMSTDSGRTHNSIWNTKTTRGDTDVLMNGSLTVGYITAGGSTATDKHNYVTETMYNAGSVGANPASAGGTAGGIATLHGQFRGWIAVNSTAAYIEFATETWISGTWSSGSDGQPKGLSTKMGYGYCATGSYGGSATYNKWNDFVPGTTAITTVARPDTCGEENHQIGQNHGYSLGSYNGNQTNNTQKINYLTDTSTAMGSDTQPKGHDGMSSGCCGTASAFLLGGV